MIILVANLGSTSFKFRLFRFDGSGEASPLAKVGYERIQEMSDPARALERARAKMANR